MFNWTKYDVYVLPATLLGMIIVAVLLAVFLRGKDEKYKKIPLMVITVLMLLLELYKQISNIVEGYSKWSIPLHFCSLFLYFFPLAVFTKGKVQEFAKTMSFVTSLWLFALFYIDPGSIIGNSTMDVFGSFYNFHTFAHHHLAILFLLLSVALGFYKFTYKHFLYVVLGFLIYGIVAVPIAHIFDVNFCNILYNSFPPLENTRLKVGQVVYTILMFIGGVIGGIASCYLYMLVQKICNKIKNKE